MAADMSCGHVLYEDLLSAVDGVPMSEYEGSHVMITGASGFIGSMLVKALAVCNDEYGTDINIIAVVHDADKAETAYGNMLDRGDITVIGTDLRYPFTYDGDIDYIFHAAAMTSSKEMLEEPDNVIMTSASGTDNMLRLAEEKHVRSFVYISSCEAYGTFTDGRTITENDLGFIDLKNLRSCYPESKRMCENLCAAYRSRYGVNVVIARPAQIIGPGILPGEGRIFAQLAGSVIRGEDIVLHTAGDSSENFCYSADCICALLILGVNGISGEVYNIVNDDEHCTVAEMASMVAERFGNGKSRVVFDIPDEDIYGYPPRTRFRMSGAKMRSLGWSPRVGMEEAYGRLIDYMKETRIC